MILIKSRVGQDTEGVAHTNIYKAQIKPI